MLQALFYAAVCALRAYHYSRVLFNPECVALEIKDLRGAFLMDALFLSFLWLLLFRFGEVRDALEMPGFPYFQKSALIVFLYVAIGGWIVSTAATHSACYTHAAASAASSTAPAAAPCPPGTPASAGQKTYTP